MNIIVGASGQIGSNVIKELSLKGVKSRGIVRDPGKGKRSDVEFVTADLLDADQVMHAFNGGSTAFIITPEDPVNTNIIGQTKKIIENYKNAIRITGVKKIVGVSCVGAQIEKGTGNILMSRMLEQAFDDFEIARIFIRPSYYYSNWLAFVESADQYGVLPTFFPGHLKFDMNSPIDLARLIGDAIVNDSPPEKKIVEVAGPEKYNAEEVARIFSELLGKNVTHQEIPFGERIQTLSDAGYSSDAARNLSEMTQAVIDGVATPERPEELIHLRTTLEEFLREEFRERTVNNTKP